MRRMLSPAWIDRLRELESARPWLLVPAGHLTLPLSGLLGVFDYWLNDLLSDALDAGFWAPPETDPLWIPCADVPWRGMVLLPLGKGNWREATAAALQHLPSQLPGGADVACMLPPQALEYDTPRPWRQAAQAVAPVAERRLRGVRQWIWFAGDDDE